MATKRQLKKRISQICGELAAEVLLASHISENVDGEAVCKIVTDIATLQSDARAKVSFSYDKVVKDFETKAEYRRARHQYEAKAFAQLRKEFGDKVVAIVKEMNAAIPADVRETLAKN